MRKIFSVLLVFVLSITLLSGCNLGGKSIVVGAKDFTEQDVLGNIVTILIEENTDIKVNYKHEMSSNVVFSAIKSGDINVYIDYTGTVYGSYLGYTQMKSPEEVYEISAKEIKEQYNLIMLESLGFNNTYTLSVRKDTADKYGLKCYSDLAKVSEELTLGATFEVLNRNDGIPNLKAVYDMTFNSEKALDGTLRYKAIENDEVQVIDAFATDALLLEYELMVLEDDKNFFPPYYAVPIISVETSEKYPELLTVLDKLTDSLNDDTMRELNYKVDVLKMNPKDVAAEFLKEKGLIPSN